MQKAPFSRILALLPITIALNIRALQSEREVDRTAGALNIEGRVYALAIKITYDLGIYL